MRFWIIIGILYISITSHARVPLNIHKGDGIVYRELADDKTYLKRLRQEDVSYLYHRTGQIRKTATGELKATFRKFETEDSYWSKFYPFSNYMIVRISKNALNKIAHSRVSYEKISAKLVLLDLKIF